MASSAASVYQPSQAQLGATLELQTIPNRNDAGHFFINTRPPTYVPYFPIANAEMAYTGLPSDPTGTGYYKEAVSEKHRSPQQLPTMAMYDPWHNSFRQSAPQALWAGFSAGALLLLFLGVVLVVDKYLVQ